jgi:hypothetical protein
MPQIKSNVIRLRHMLDACQKALRFTRGKLMMYADYTSHNTHETGLLVVAEKR